MVVTIKNQATEEQLEFTSWNQASRHVTGSDTPKNAETCKKALAKAGWSIMSVTDEHVRGSKAPTDILERLIKSVAKVDKQHIKELERERNALASTVKSSEDAKKLMKLNQTIEEAHHPQVDLDTILAYVTELYNNKEGAE
jgi:hypothetical protein